MNGVCRSLKKKEVHEVELRKRWCIVHTWCGLVSHSIKASPCPSVSLSYNHILVLHAGCTIVVTRKVITQFKSSVCTEGKRGRKLGWE